MPTFDPTANLANRQRYTVDYDAIATMQSGYGVCDNYSGMFVAISRWLGVPTYFAYGQVHTSGDFSSSHYTGHAWCKMYDNGTWYVFDPNVDFYITGGQSYTYTHGNSSNPMYRYCELWTDMSQTTPYYKEEGWYNY